MSKKLLNRNRLLPNGPELVIKDTVFDIEYLYPDEVIEFVNLLEPHIRVNAGGYGKIWINGKKLYRRKSMLLRPFFADPFAWGCLSEDAKATALEICLKIFYDPKVALKLYTAFLHTFVKEWNEYKGRVTIDITDFILSNYHRCGTQLHTYYYIDTSKAIHEIDIWHNPATNVYSGSIKDDEIKGYSLKEIKDEISFRLGGYTLYE